MGKQDGSIFTDHLLEQTLYNLLLNTIAAAPVDSLLEIHADVFTVSVRLLTADNEPGMPFAPGPRTVSPGPSTKRFCTGQGIPFAFKVCDALADSITFVARGNDGTLIELKLPRYHQII